MRFSVVAASLLAVCAQAIQITSPTKLQVVDLAAGFEVKWSTVSSDVTKAHLFLVNMAGGSQPFSKDLGEVDLTKGSIVVVEPSAPNGEGYQFNVQSVSQHNTGILAQSQQFEVKSVKKSTKSTTTAASSTSASASASGSDASAVSSEASSRTTLAPTVTGAASSNSTKSSSTSVSTGAAASYQAVQGGSFLALAMGLLAVVA